MLAAFLFLELTTLNGVEPALTAKRAAAFLGVSPGTLAVWRSRRTGPPCHYSGSKPVYYLSELREWQQLCTEERLGASSSFAP